MNMKRIVCLMLMVFCMAAVPCVLADGEAGNTAAEIELDAAWETFLLIGADTREDDGVEGRADAIMVCAVNHETGAIRLLSLARDMWIQLPGRESYNKINTAFRFGGAEMMMEAVNQTLGLNITKYAAVNFYGFCDVIDALGGVEIELEADEISVINNSTDDYGDTAKKPIPSDATSAVLSGAQALTYARIRKLDSDFARTGRQRKVIVAVLNKVKELSLFEQMAFVGLCLENVETNVGFTDIISLGTLVVTHGFDDLEQLALPTRGNYHHDSADGTSKVIFNKEETRKEALTFIYGDYTQN